MKRDAGCVEEVVELMDEIKQFPDEDLQQLFKLIEAEVHSRRQDSQPQVIYTHGCRGSSDYHKRKYKHWAKHIHSVDTTKFDGYAFIGDWLELERYNYVPSGAIVVEVCSDDFTCYRITEDRKEEIAGVHRYGEFRSFVIAVDEALRDEETPPD